MQLAQVAASRSEFDPKPRPQRPAHWLIAPLQKFQEETGIQEPSRVPPYRHESLALGIRYFTTGKDAKGDLLVEIPASMIDPYYLKQEPHLESVQNLRRKAEEAGYPGFDGRSIQDFRRKVKDANNSRLSNKRAGVTLSEKHGYLPAAQQRPLLP